MKVDSLLQNNMSSSEIKRSGGKADKIDTVAKDMESLFLRQMIKTMRQASGVSQDKGFGSNMYSDMFDMELANVMSERGIGVKEVFARQLNRQAGISESKAPIPSFNNQLYNISIKESVQSQAKASYQQEIKSYDTAKIIKDLDKSISESVDKAQPWNVGLPIKGAISSEYGMRVHPISGELKFHHGMDIAANEGTPIHPVKAGEVIFSGEQRGYGNVVIIKHADGYITKYAHCQKNLVSKGDMVGVDTEIGLVGSTGYATGPHLHFEVAHNGKSMNPDEIFS